MLDHSCSRSSWSILIYGAAAMKSFLILCSKHVCVVLFVVQVVCVVPSLCNEENVGVFISLTLQPASLKTQNTFRQCSAISSKQHFKLFLRCFSRNCKLFPALSILRDYTICCYYNRYYLISPPSMHIPQLVSYGWYFVFFSNI